MAQRKSAEIRWRKSQARGYSHERSASDRAESMGEGNGVISSSRDEGAEEFDELPAGDPAAMAFLTISWISMSLGIASGVDSTMSYLVRIIQVCK